MSRYNVYIDPSFNNTPSESVFNNIQSGVVHLEGSGLVWGDKAFLNIASGIYTEDVNVTHPSGDMYFIGDSNIPFLKAIASDASGGIYIRNMEVDYIARSSGSLEVQNSYVSGFLINNSSPSTSFTDTNIIGSGNIETVSGVYFTNCVASGLTSKIIFDDVDNVTYKGGTISNYGSLEFYNCNSVDMLNANGYNHVDYPISMSGVLELNVTYCTFTNMNSGVLWLNNSSGNINYSIIASSGSSPISGTFNNVIVTDTSCIYEYGVGPETYSDIKFDPKIVDPVSGDLRISHRSACASAGQPLLTPASGTYNVESSLLTPDSIQFFAHEDNFKVSRPSGMYIHPEGKFIYVKSHSGLHPNINIKINSQLDIKATIPTYQSLALSGSHPAPDDYRIVKRQDRARNVIEYYAVPYTIIPVENILNSGEEIVNVNISGNYNYTTQTRDHESVPEYQYWVVEDNNQLLHRRSELTHKSIETYPLFTPPSGGVITLDSLLYQGNNSYKTDEVYSDASVYVNDYGDPESELITLAGRQPTIKWFDMSRETNKNVKAITEYNDLIYVLYTQEDQAIESSGDIVITKHMDIYNKFSENMIENKIKTISVPMTPSGIPTDMTIDDEGFIYISTTNGTIHKYNQHYDYALITRAAGESETTVTFRENYAGVKI